MSHIYKIINKVNNKQYIGKTNLSIDERFKEHCADSTKERCSNRPLYRAMRKYGIENFSVEEIIECSPEEANFYEIFFIQYFNTYGKGGYNATRGGDGKILFDYNKVIELYQQGLTYKQIALELGCCIYTITNILNCLKIDVERRKQLHASKPVKQFSIDNEYITTYSSCKQAAMSISALQNKPYYKSMQTKISWAARGIRNTAFGYKWRF